MMKRLLIALALASSITSAQATVIYESVISSGKKPVEICYLDRFGRLKLQKITVYTYLLHDGSRVEQPYKIPHLRDERKFTVKHPILCLIWNTIGGSMSSVAYRTISP